MVNGGLEIYGTEKLNPEQAEAARVRKNTVITAGAGSGKTTVLACRYACLIRSGLNPDEILSITFTNKASNEMTERIYRTLERNSSHDWARAALGKFYKASIQTLDSFCADIARSGAALFGISPDFSIGDALPRELASKSAFAFIIDNRDNPALKTMIADRGIEDLAESLFASTVLNFSSISSPVNYDKIFEKEFAIAKNGYYTFINEYESDMANSKRKKNVVLSAYPEFDELCARTGSETRDNAIILMSKYYDKMPGELNKIKRGPFFLSLVNFALNIENIREIYKLLDNFQNEFNIQKRLAGILSFNDVARLALDTLKRFPDIRRMYKTRIKSIMVDEFQDNNTLQKELLFLLSENEDRVSGTVPNLAELHPDKLFFVGDEKQSIYRFRGADVSVFRSLGKDFPKINLDTNYRSRIGLIDAFNLIFPHIFPVSDKAPEYEAEFMRLKGVRVSDSPVRPHLHFAVFNKEDFPHDKSDTPSSYDMEADFIARTILNLCAENSNFTILKRGTNDEIKCEFSDIAVLMRKKTHAIELEKALIEANIPFNAEEPVNFLNERCVTDMISYMNLIAYPRDKISYAAVLRSPVANLSDCALSVIILKFNKIPFSDKVFEFLDADDIKKYKRAGEMYRALSDSVRKGEKTISQIVNHLWYDYGLRYEVISEAGSAGYAYDYFFELASRADSANLTLSMFLIDLKKRMSKRKNNAKKIEDMDIPVERNPGVRILTVHKSKGLEFPVVFIYAAGEPEKPPTNKGSTFTWKEDDTPVITLNIGAARELPEKTIPNYFQLIRKEEEKKLDTAELKRLLYVAATRAESELFITAASEHDKPSGTPSFFELLRPVITQNTPLWDIMTIPYKSWDEIRYKKRGKTGSMDEAVIPYSKTSVEKTHEPSVLHKTAGNSGNLIRTAAITDNSKKKRTSFKNYSAGFGILVHEIIEEKFSGFFQSRTTVSTRVKKAETLAQNFFDSALGRRAVAASFRKTEYSFITLHKEAGKRVYISGKIDLLFRDNEGITIVDYKTDRIVTPEIHYEQLAVYREAAGNIFPGEKITAYIYYLRHNIEVMLPSAPNY